jgi:NitT/TauT family transport system permease protein
MIGALFQHPNSSSPLLLVTLLRAAAFTAKEAAVGFAMGAVGGFAIGAALAHSRVLQRGFLPYVVASQTVPILAIAPMVVIWFTSPQVHAPAWFAVAVIASYLTFFPVAIATLRGLHAADHRALELMRSLAASNWTVLWKLRFPTALPYLFSALKVSATASIVGAIIGESPSSIAGGLGGAILNFAQYYTFQPQNLWATNLIAALLGIVFFLAVVLAEKIVVRAAPENVA